jgi:ethanolamine ammonia-lyase small subunit
MEETLQLLKDHAEASDNLWLSIKLDLLSEEIKLEIVNAELQVLKKLKL